jgi:hypothetical protein
MRFPVWTQIKKCSLETLLKNEKDISTILTYNPGQLERVQLFATDLTMQWKKSEFLGD